MNDNYLWDRSGEPDTEIQKLEELLGTLRYQPRPLEIPADLRLQRKRSFIPWAIAAALALLVIAAGLWLRLSHSQTSPRFEARSGLPPKDQSPPSVPPPNEKLASGVLDKPAPNRKRSASSLVAISPRRARPIETRPPQLTEEELAQKEQLVMALRLVSAKLNVAQRKTQGLPQPNIIRNQHKIG